ncbi:hypothetical protein ILUMI_18912 [Ignelater luminosus]|uniref:Odorant receptor n=1 Tax=Ignelater luminosus TaxID=2038154 RepID=A0A8K0CLJ7_IGNLU|nr:hypothetical protein ILUMI_18912 [Ignelater luminosus]
MVKSNNADAFKMQCSMMTTTGVWPKENPSIYYKTKTVASWFFAIGLCVTMWMEALNDIKDFAKLSEILYIMVTVTAYIIKLSVFTYRKQSFLNMIKFLEDPVFASYPDQADHFMAKTISSSTIIAKVYRYLVMCCVVLFFFYPILDNKTLPFPFPYDLGKYTPFMFGFQLIGAGYDAWNNSCIDTLCTSLMGIAAAQLDILCEKIIHIKEQIVPQGDSEISEETDKDTIEKLKQCVEHHLAIMLLVDYIEHIFTMGLFAQFIASVIVICNTLFHFVLISISSQFFMLADYLMILLVQLFIYCWYGNEIIFKSGQLGEACYMSNWELSGNEVRLYLFMIMERSKKPLRITTMKLSELSLTTFASVNMLLDYNIKVFDLYVCVYFRYFSGPILV